VFASHLSGLPSPGEAGWGPEFFASLFAHAANPFNLANLVQSIAPYSGALLLSPAAWLGALPHLAKDLAFGMDIGNHHFAPAIPAMFAGLALTIRAAVPEARRTAALVQAGLCVLLAGAFWGPGPIGRNGWERMASWERMLPSEPGKAMHLRSSFPPGRNRIVTGGLGGILFDAPRLGFLGSIHPPEAPDLGDADIVLELWDQGFTEWAPMDRMQDQLAEVLAGKPASVWLSAASGTLALARGSGEDGTAGKSLRLIGVDSAWSVTDPPASDARDSGAGRMVVAWRDLAGDAFPDPRMSHAVVAMRPDGRVLPLGLRSAGRGWAWFPVLADIRPGEDIRVQWLETDQSPEDMGPVRRWPVRAEVRLRAGSI
jgi:hypothetical protein